MTTGKYFSDYRKHRYELEDEPKKQQNFYRRRISNEINHGL